ncbi:hypothetical protein N8148_03040 [Gammaproteobacteria bacterium]|nr:hypothetical protein [Gammaproteobacteria bacterium]
MNRKFKGGSNRNSADGKLDYEGFNSPIVDWAYAQYMHKHRFLEDGTFRDSDNWQNGGEDWLAELPKSLGRHYKDYHLTKRGYRVIENGKVHDLREILCGIIFNAKSELHELLKETKEVNRNYHE